MKTNYFVCANNVTFVCDHSQTPYTLLQYISAIDQYTGDNSGTSWRVNASLQHPDSGYNQKACRIVHYVGLVLTALVVLGPHV